MKKMKKLVALLCAISMIIPGNAAFASNVNDTFQSDQAQTNAESESLLGAESGAERGLESQAKFASGNESESETKIESENKSESGTEAESESKTESGTEAESESKTESGTESDSESKTEPGTESETGSETESETESESESESETEPERDDEERENSWRFEDGVWSGAFSNFAVIAEDFLPWSNIDGYYVNSSGNIIRDARTRGIDVSEWQGLIHWDRVVNDDVDFAIVRCGAGQNYTDKMWNVNRLECERLGIPYGTYLYSYAQSEEDAKKEAEHVLKLVEGTRLSYPIYYDLEDITISELGNTEIAKIAKAFCDVIESAGYKVQIYANTYWWTNYLTDSYFNRFSDGKWVAQYNDQCTYKGGYSIWQSTNQGKIDGIEGNVDIDYIMETNLRPELANTELCVNSKWYYFDEQGDFSKGWVKHHNNQYYYDVNGVMQKHIIKIEDKYYGFNEWTGVQLKGEHFFTDGSDDHWYYFEPDKGVMQTGWVKHHGNQYYYNSQGQMQYDEKYLNGYWYYFNEWTGVMARGWTTHHNEWYYYDSNGRMYHGEKFMDGNWYYFDEVTGITANKGFTYHHNSWYYYDDYGYMQYGEKYLDGNWYYFNPYTGIMAIGWTEHHGYQYYYDNKGRMYHGKQVIDGKTYYFDMVTGILNN